MIAEPATVRAVAGSDPAVRAAAAWSRPHGPRASAGDATAGRVRDSGAVVRIGDRRLLGARPAGGDPAVQVDAGVAWITQEGDRRDHILRAGQRVALARHGRIVIQALSAGGVAVLEDLRA